MACSPHTCTNHNTGTSTCSNHRGACASNRPISWVANPGEIMTAARIEEARVDIRNEVSRWNQHSNYNMTLYQSGSISAGQVITNEVFNNLDNMVGQMYGSYIANIGNGALIDDSHWDTLLARYDAVRDNCICNSDCSCNSICSCYGNCGCNYSDERLKYDIKPI